MTAYYRIEGVEGVEGINHIYPKRRLVIEKKRQKLKRQ
jgi:hypothetical protein